MISLSHALPTDDPLSRRHLQQIPSNTSTTSTDQLPLEVPRAWPFYIPQQQIDDTKDHSMQPDWASSASHMAASKMAAVGTHKREPSLSSTGSAGPASPYNQNTTNPQIVTADFGSDGFDQLAVDPTSSNQNYQIASLGKFPGYQSIDTNLPDMAYPMAIPAGPNSNSNNNNNYNTMNNIKPENNGVPNLDLSNTGSRPQASSVASSSVADDLPATPAQNEVEAKEGNERRKAYGTAPKLDRTITDIFADELYNPNFQITSTSPPEQPLAVSPVNDIFSQRLNAANSQHLSAAQSPVVSSTSRTGSPFRSNSPLAASHHDFASAPRTALPSGLGQFNRNQPQNTVQSAPEQQQQQPQQQQASQQPSQTISPKDATIEFNEQEADQNLPLFPPADNTSLDFNKAMAMSSQPMNSMPAPNTQFNFAMQPQMPHHLTAPTQFTPYGNFNGPSPPRLSSAGSSTGSSAHTPLVRARPMGTAADSGTYTCTYHGCTLRFETPALLQKHKREGHRQVQGIGAPGPRLHDTSMNAGMIGSQAGPHRCNRINPSTGKPCNTVFSRPYDLTRHEDTIHNARKQKVSCELCTEEKTFSRADALTRHFRVCHPDVEVPGKRRRG